MIHYTKGDYAMRRPKMVTINCDMWHRSSKYGRPYGVKVWYREPGHAQMHYTSTSFELALCHNLTKKQRAQVKAAMDLANNWERIMSQ